MYSRGLNQKSGLYQVFTVAGNAFDLDKYFASSTPKTICPFCNVERVIWCYKLDLMPSPYRGTFQAQKLQGKRWKMLKNMLSIMPISARAFCKIF